MSVEVRPYHEEDEDFLFELYASTRAEELDAWGWDEDQRAVFLELQFKAQRQSYTIQYGDADHSIIMDAGRPIGQMMVLCTDDEYRLVDISLLPEHRNGGIGTRLIRRLLDKAFDAGKPVGLSVVKISPAVGLYQRLGFVILGDDGLYLQMVARPVCE